MNISKIKYTIIFIVILLFVIYQILLSFNVTPYFFTGEDIIVILVLLVSILLFFISNAIERISLKKLHPDEDLALETSVLEAGPEKIDITPLVDKKEEISYFLKLQSYFKEVKSASELLNKLLVAAAKITHSKRVSIFLYNKKGDELGIYKTIGWDKGEIKMLKNIKIKPGEGITGRVFIDAKPLIVNDIERENGFTPKEKYRSKAFISFPLFSGSDIIGVINLTEKERDVYSKQELDILTFIINEVSIHISTLRLYTKKQK